jgi:Zn-dependent M32 family carboxypeptidase
MEAEELKPQILAAIDDLNQYLLGNVTGLGLIETLEDTIRDVKDYAMTIRENKTMENLNEGKKKSYMSELAEIDKQSALVALEAKINKLAEMAEAKTARLAMVNEDENLSELISKQAVKEMNKEIKEIEKLKEKLLKEFTKKGGKMTEVIDEEEKMDEGYGEEKEMEEAIEEEVVAEEEIDEASCGSYEEDDVNEEVNRWQKLAGL